MINTKISKDREFRYRKVLCKICEKELFRTIENNGSVYHCPALVIHCAKCGSKHFFKYDLDGIEFGLFDSLPEIYGNY